MKVFGYLSVGLFESMWQTFTSFIRNVMENIAFTDEKAGTSFSCRLKSISYIVY